MCLSDPGWLVGEPARVGLCLEGDGDAGSICRLEKCRVDVWDGVPRIVARRDDPHHEPGCLFQLPGTREVADHGPVATEVLDQGHGVFEGGGIVSADRYHRGLVGWP